LDFWFENKPSGNPALQALKQLLEGNPAEGIYLYEVRWQPTVVWPERKLTLSQARFMISETGGKKRCRSESVHPQVSTAGCYKLKHFDLECLAVPSLLT
jgi:hypothetical protein